MEVEQIYEKAWYAVTETCLAMTIFRDEFDVRFIVMFGVLLFVKCFSWIGSGRVEFVGLHCSLCTSYMLMDGLPDGTTTTGSSDFVPCTPREQLSATMCCLWGNGMACHHRCVGEGEAKHDGTSA